LAAGSALAAPTTPTFPVSWTSAESSAISIAQGSVAGPNGEVCCLPSAPQCQVQVQAQTGTHYWDGVGNQTRFDSATGIIVTQYGIGKEMLVAPNGTCTQYCPTQGAFDPSPFWPSAGDKEKIKDLGKKTVDGVECTHFQWVEHIFGIIKIQETNMYVVVSDKAEASVPVAEHDIIEPFGQPAGTEDTHWSKFQPGQPAASLFQVTGIPSCPMSPNCGNDNQVFLARRLRDNDFVTYAHYDQQGKN